jgi:hypothetical protein
MTKTDMTKLLRSMGADENTVTAMENAYDMGVEFERERLCNETEPLIARLVKQTELLEKQLMERA